MDVGNGKPDAATARADVEDDDGEKGEAHKGVLPVVSVDLGEDVAHDEDDDDHDLREWNQLVIDGW